MFVSRPTSYYHCSIRANLKIVNFSDEFVSQKQQICTPTVHIGTSKGRLSGACYMISRISFMEMSALHNNRFTSKVTF